MARHRSDIAWKHTSTLAAIVRNAVVGCWGGGEAVPYLFFHPLYEEKYEVRMSLRDIAKRLERE
jgi:hypothetical protein